MKERITLVCVCVMYVFSFFITMLITGNETKRKSEFAKNHICAVTEGMPPQLSELSAKSPYFILPETKDVVYCTTNVNGVKITLVRPPCLDVGGNRVAVSMVLWNALFQRMGGYDE